MYIKRNKQGDIIGISEIQDKEHDEAANDSDPEFIRFLKGEALKNANMQRDLEQTDKEFVRVLEDVIQILMDRNIIQFTDLPKAARDKFAKRHHLRSKRPGLDLLDETDDDDLKFL